MRPLPLLNSNLKSKQLQVNDSPDNCQIPVASQWVFLNIGSLFILLFIVERWRKYCWLSCRNFLKKTVSVPFKILKIAWVRGAFPPDPPPRLCPVLSGDLQRTFSCPQTPCRSFLHMNLYFVTPLIVLVHWNNSPRIFMSPHSELLSWFRANQLPLNS